MFLVCGAPQAIQLSENFRALTGLGGVCCKGVIIQGRQLPSDLPVMDKSCLIKKGVQCERLYMNPKRGIVRTDRR